MNLLWYVIQILVLIVILFIIYSIVPTILYRVFHMGVLQKGDSTHEVALTFDDGPDPRYTPVLLDLLKKYHVKATFFIVGENAEKYPELIRRMQQEGHQIGVHHYNHLSNWLLLPHQIINQCDKAADVVEKITGNRPIYYRPPWGHLNLFIHFIVKRYRIVIWSAILGDWNLSLGKEKLKRRIEKNLYGGSVICLHDRGTNIGADEQAPEMTISALTDILEKYGNDFDYVTVDRLYNPDEHVEKFIKG